MDGSITFESSVLDAHNQISGINAKKAAMARDSMDCQGFLGWQFNRKKS
jgi:hypothetical protein